MKKLLWVWIALIGSAAPARAGFSIGTGGAAAKSSAAAVAKAIAKSSQTVSNSDTGNYGTGNNVGGAPIVPVPGITVKWAYTGESVYYASPAVAPDGTVYFGTSDGFVYYSGFWMKGQRPPSKPYGVYAYNPNGTQKWKYSDGDSPVRGSPVLGPDGTLYIVLEKLGASLASTVDELHAVTPSGQQKWKVTVSTTYSEIGALEPAIAADGTIYVAGRDFTAFKPDGTVKWKDLAGPTWTNVYYAAPSIGPDGTIYYVHWATATPWGQNLRALNPDGTVKWDSPNIGTYPNTCSPSIAADGTIYLGLHDYSALSGATNAALLAFTSTGAIKWAFPAGDFDIRDTPSIAADGTIYFGTKGDNGFVYALNPDGTQKWKYNTFTDVVNCPTCGVDVYDTPAIAVDGTVYVSNEYGFLYAFHPDGTLKWKDNALMPQGGATDWSSAVIMPDGTLYSGRTYGVFMAVQTDTMGPSTSAQWPRAHYDNGNTGRSASVSTTVLRK